MRWLASGLAVAAAALGCRTPTQVTVEIVADLPCSQLQGVDIIVGDPTGVAEKIAATSTEQCEAGDPMSRIGSIVITPSDEKNAPFGVQVVAGVDRNIQECTAPDYEGCIVARRRMRFLPHTELYMRITLHQTCKGVACASDMTCVAQGCVSSEISDPEACMDPSFEACDDEGIAGCAKDPAACKPPS